MEKKMQIFKQILAGAALGAISFGLTYLYILLLNVIGI